jgi:hypothetical protein
MSTSNHSEAISEILQNTPYDKSLHRHYSFIPKGVAPREESHARFLERVMDISQGAALCMELVGASDDMRSAVLDGAADVTPVLSITDTAIASRFAIAALHMLATEAQRTLERMGRRAEA